MRRAVLIVLLMALAAQPAAAQAPAVPAAPTGLRPGTVTASSVEVVWNDWANDETRYEVLHGVVGGAWTNVRLPADTTSWALDAPAPDTEYVVRVRACNLAGCSAVPPSLLVRTQPAATMTPTPVPTHTPTATSTALPTETPTAAPTAPATPAPCPGVFGGLVVAENTLTVTCVKPTETAWPDGIEFRGWQVQP